MSEQAARLAAYGRRTYTRPHPRDPLKVLRWQVAAIGAQDNRLHIAARVREVGADIWLLDPIRDATLGFDELIIVNPRTRVDDGVEPNPDYNALEQGSQPTRRKYRDDAVEALKQELDRFLERRIDA